VGVAASGEKFNLKLAIAWSLLAGVAGFVTLAGMLWSLMRTWDTQLLAVSGAIAFAICPLVLVAERNRSRREQEARQAPLRALLFAGVLFVTMAVGRLVTSFDKDELARFEILLSLGFGINGIYLMMLWWKSRRKQWQTQSSSSSSNVKEN
jgi:hypothetical protein